MDETRTVWYAGDPTQAFEEHSGYFCLSASTLGLQVPFSTQDPSWPYMQTTNQPNSYTGLSRGSANALDGPSCERPMHYGGLLSPSDPNPMTYIKQNFPVTTRSRWVPTTPMTPPGSETFLGSHFGGLSNNDQSSPILLAPKPILTSPTMMFPQAMASQSVSDAWMVPPLQTPITEIPPRPMSTLMGVLCPDDHSDPRRPKFIMSRDRLQFRPQDQLSKGQLSAQQLSVQQFPVRQLAAQQASAHPEDQQQTLPQEYFPEQHQDHQPNLPQLETCIKTPELAEIIELNIILPKKKNKGQVEPRKPRTKIVKKHLTGPPSLRTATRRNKPGPASLKDGETKQHLQKREHHNVVEKEYRDRLTKGYEDLLDVLSALPREKLKSAPNPDGKVDSDDQREEKEVLALIAGAVRDSHNKQKRISKVGVLQNACRVIKFLESEKRKLQEEVMGLRGDLEVVTGREKNSTPAEGSDDSEAGD